MQYVSLLVKMYGEGGTGWRVIIRILHYIDSLFIQCVALFGNTPNREKSIQVIRKKGICTAVFAVYVYLIHHYLPSIYIASNQSP